MPVWIKPQFPQTVIILVLGSHGDRLIAVSILKFIHIKAQINNTRLSMPLFLGFPCGSAGKESACNVGDLRLIPGLGRSPGEGKGYPLQYSGLENSKSQT